MNTDSGGTRTRSAVVAVIGAIAGAAILAAVQYACSSYAVADSETAAGTPPASVPANVSVPVPPPPPPVVAPSEELVRTQAERDWFRYFYSYYGSTSRLRQYGIADERMQVYARAIPDFIPIPRVTSKVYCPQRSDGLVGRDVLYYASRLTVLPRSGNVPLIYAIDYHGSGAFAYGEKTFDTLFPVDDARPGPVVKMKASDAAGLFAPLLKAIGAPALSPHDYYTPFSISSVDVNGDGSHDFTLGGRIFTSTNGSFVMSGDTTFDGKEVVLARRGETPIALLPNGSAIDVYRIGAGGPPVRLASVALGGTFAEGRPYVLLPLDGALVPEPALAFIAVLRSSVELIVIDDDWRARRVLSAPALQAGEVIVGARGDFTGDGIPDVWIAEQRWKNAAGETVGRIQLLSSALVSQHAEQSPKVTGIESLAATTLYGSRRYTDYDGIGASLSPIAGDLDGDGRPDLSFPGHRHLSEAGAFFVLPGDSIRPGEMSVEDPAVVRIAGQPVSQVGPPFVHWDATDINGDGLADVILPVDNDVCAGLNAGAIYVLDGHRVMEARKAGVQ